jgi:hypothetical protein
VKSKKLGGTAIHMRDNRLELDTYFTPQIATDSLLLKESFEGTILEPACGYGHISKILKEKLPNKVISSDLRLDAYENPGVDFLGKDIIKVDNIITNPPYSLAKAFIKKAVDSSNKVAMLLRLAFLESMDRFEFFKQYEPARIHVFSFRLPHWNGTFWENSGQFSHAWFVWEEHEGKTEIDWIGKE